MSPSYALPNYEELVSNAQQELESERASRTAKALRVVSTGSSMLLAAIVSALLVGANQLVESWTDSNLLTAWIALWIVAFAALALLAGPSRRAAASLGAALKAERARRVRAQQDAHYWESALGDARLMADIQRAMGSDAHVMYALRREAWPHLLYVGGF